MFKLWGGRFTEPVNCTLARLNCSLPIDSRLFAEDLDGSKAYAHALKTAGVLTDGECKIIVKTLELLRYEWIERKVKFMETDEDVHTVNERRLIEICGEIGLKLHTGRSRNDQVATDMRLWMKKAIAEIKEGIMKTIKTAINLAEKSKDVLIPGYTHMQRAQPILFSHWLLSHVFALKEDCLRFKDLLGRVDVLPLGSGALAGNPLDVDRQLLANLLGFLKVSENSMHAVSDRDFAVEFAFNISMTSLHLSRLAEDLFLYSTKEFNFLSISEAFSTGSSLMPQKRNPDSLELIRGSTGSVLGSVVGLFTILKGLPSTYNKDLQYDKKLVFESFDILDGVLEVMSGVLSTLEIKRENCEKALTSDMLATDWAYYLVKKGIPFRTAHEIIGKIVAHAEKTTLDLGKIPLHELKQFCEKFDDDIKEILNFKGVVSQYNGIGGTAPSSVEKQIFSLKMFIKFYEN